MKIQLQKFFAVLAAFAIVVAFPATAQAGTFPGVNAKLYYAVGDSSGIGVMGMDGSNPTQFVNASTMSVSVSPDGKKIAYGSTFGNSSIHIANIDGTNDTVVASGSSPGFYNPTWSPDGSKLVFSGGGSSQIYTVNIDGTGLTQLTNESLDNDFPNYSPDGSKIVYQRTLGGNGVDIVVMDSNGGNKTVLAGTSAHEQHPRWSPDGTKILYVRFIDNTYTYDVFSMNSNGSGQTRLLSRVGQDAQPTYTPDGTKIIFLGDSMFGQGYLIYSMNTDGTNPTVIGGTTRANYVDVRPLTLKPTTATTNPSITVYGKTATINIPALYTDPYGGGIDPTSVTITTQPSSGTVTVNGSGVATYTQTSVAASRPTMWHKLTAKFIPKVYAAPADSFGFSVCSTTAASLCSTGTVSVVLAASTTASGAAATGAPNTGLSSESSAFPVAAGLMGIVLLGVAVRRIRHGWKS